jgi:hypothetical protein
MVDVDHGRVEAVANKGTARWRGIASLNPNNITKHDSSEQDDKFGIRPSVKQRDSDLVVDENDVDISLIHRRIYLLSAGIGDTNKHYNKYKGKFGLVLWIINICIHFGLDFYEANTIFDISWATCIGLFFLTLIACCISMTRHSIPWFLKGVKKLKKDGHYPKTLKRIRLIARVSKIPLNYYLLINLDLFCKFCFFVCLWCNNVILVICLPEDFYLIQ